MATHDGRSFVFYDPTGRRWGVFRRAMQTAALALALFLLVVFTGTQLPALGLPAVAPMGQFGDVPAIIRGQKAEKNVPYHIPRPIIDRYVSQGYRFVTVSDLIGRSRAEIMPKPSPRELQMARIEGQALDTKARFFQWLGILFLTAIYLTRARSLLFAVLALQDAP